MSVTDAQLAAALGADRVRRRPWPYASSFPIEELQVEGGTSGSRTVLFKDLTRAAELPRPGFVSDPRREIAAYRDVLGPEAIGAPGCYASVIDEERAWLFLELVDGRPLWQIGEIEAWQEAARWLAALHARPVTPSHRLLRYDAEHLRRRFSLASGLPRAELIGTAVAERLAAFPVSFIHGEFCASNVLIERNGGPVRVRPVDWETCGTGPGVLDLAALTAGSWPEAARLRIEQAYLDACPARLRPTPEDIDYARLLLAGQWFGWSARWTPPPHHAHDWRAEVVRLTERLAL
jgi:hypothetical protein